LLLLLHNHAAVFLFSSAYLAVTTLFQLRSLSGVLEVALCGYLAWYLYRSMRRLYRQSRMRTLLKFSVLGCAYLLSAVVMLILTMFYSVATL
jgi:hypothetical protein